MDTPEVPTVHRCGAGGRQWARLVVQLLVSYLTGELFSLHFRGDITIPVTPKAKLTQDYHCQFPDGYAFILRGQRFGKSVPRKGADVFSIKILRDTTYFILA